MNYQNNTQAAIEGDDRNLYISESGAYEGVFTMARAITASTGAKGIEFNFKSNDGEVANRLTLYTQNKDGAFIFGYKQLCGIMTVLGVQGIVGEQATVNIYDYDQKKEVPTQSTIYPSMINQPIGVIFQKEEYEKSDGSIGEKVSMWGFYRASDKATVLEVGKGLQSDGSRLKSMIDGLRDKKLNRGAPQASQANNYNSPQQTTPDFDDDIPF